MASVSPAKRVLRRIASIVRKPFIALRAARQAIGYFGSGRVVLRKAWRVYRGEGLAGLSRRARAMSQLAAADARVASNWQERSRDLYPIPTPDDSFAPLVSVIVPNFNHAPYLRERLDSIYKQDYSNFEVILLDDASSDESHAVLAEYAERHKHRTTLLINTVNSGGVFHQWRKGLSIARGELVWIAESDDYCDATHLKELVRFFSNEAVMLAFCRSEFVTDDKRRLWSTDESLFDCLAGQLDKPFIHSAHQLVNHAWAKKNVVPNASSAVFRHPGAMPLLTDETWSRLRLCGDWIFYLHVIRGGLVAYSPHTTNYYRQHEKGTAFQTRQRDTYYSEFEAVARTVLELYRIDTDILQDQRRALYNEWCIARGSEGESDFETLYNLERARAGARRRDPNLLMAGFALIAGGGETFPIMLANTLHRRGMAVTFFNCHHVPTEPGVRRMLNASLPLVELQHLGRVGLLCAEFGIELVHSHHAWVDMTLARCLVRQPMVRQVVSLHGMYEIMTPEAFKNLLPLFEDRVDGAVFTATKNLAPFSSDLQARKHFTRIRNALEIQPIHPVDRAALGIASGDFVFCMVARAIPEKGWEEAIRAIEIANTLGDRTVHLLLIGEGGESERLASRASETIHFLGFRSNVRDYYAMSDMGLLPSRFPGESAPLVLIDCLLAGRPVLASCIGEIPDMLLGDGGCAGELFDLGADLSIPIETLAAQIAKVANHAAHYRALLDQVGSAARKFDPELMAASYEDFYRRVLLTSRQQAVQT